MPMFHIAIPHWASTTIIILLCTLPWWFAPFLIKRLIKTPMDIVCDFCGSGGLALPGEVADYFFMTGTQLREEGFQATPPFRLRTVLRNTQMWVQVHQRGADIASPAMVITRMADNVTTIRRLEFRTQFEDGTELRTNNIGLSEPYGPIEGITVTHLPGLEDAHSLYQVHRRITAEKKAKAKVLSPLDVVAYQTGVERQEARHKLSHGYAYEDRAARLLRLTWRGVFAMHFSTALGFRQYREWQNARAANATLRRIGMAA